MIRQGVGVNHVIRSPWEILRFSEVFPGFRFVFLVFLVFLFVLCSCLSLSLVFIVSYEFLLVFLVFPRLFGWGS